MDFEARLAAVPAHATVRGMFFQFLAQGLSPGAAAETKGRRYVAFKNYPVREYIGLLASSCAEYAGRIPAAQHVRLLGRQVYPNYAETLTGTAIFAMAGRNFRRVVELCPAAYRVSMSPCTVEIQSFADGHAVVQLRELWNMPDLHQVGIWEGAMDVCGARGEIRVQVHSLCDVDFELNWREAADG